MKQLPLVEGTEPAAVKAKPSGGTLKNAMFVIGLIAAVVGSAAGYGLYQYSNQIYSNYQFEAEMNAFDEGVDQLTAFQAVVLYQELKVEEGLGDWYEPNFMRYNRQSEIMRPASFGLMGVAGLGLVVMLASFFMKS